MKKIELKKKIKKVWDNNKGVIITVGSLAGVALATAVAMNKSKDTNKLLEEASNIENNEIDLGRDCIITYSVEDTGEVLWKGMCYESYVNDVKEMDMEYEEFRKLNGIE